MDRFLIIFRSLVLLQVLCLALSQVVSLAAVIYFFLVLDDLENETMHLGEHLMD